MKISGGILGPHALPMVTILPSSDRLGAAQD
jgi:hypothetical protein